jgi:hypothetical protein
MDPCAPGVPLDGNEWPGRFSLGSSSPRKVIKLVSYPTEFASTAFGRDDSQKHVQSMQKQEGRHSPLPLASDLGGGRTHRIREGLTRTLVWFCACVVLDAGQGLGQVSANASTSSCATLAPDLFPRHPRSFLAACLLGSVATSATSCKAGKSTISEDAGLYAGL